jgi:hypothetical protein
VSVDRRALDDLVTFAHLERDAADIEPWAEILAWLHRAGILDAEQTAWAVKLYNATDDLGSAFAIMAHAGSPAEWAMIPQDHADAINALPISQERRNLRGGRLTIHLDSYVKHLGPDGQVAWLWQGIPPGSGCRPAEGFYPLMAWMRDVWGTGRQSAFEWAEFAGKTGLVPVEAPDACLWESSGPRDSLVELWGLVKPAPADLDDAAARTKAHLADNGVDLSWWDFETVICDFKVMRRGRYYPGRHLGMLREEIVHAPPQWRGHLEDAWNAVIPAPWRYVEPGDRRDLRPVYRATGKIVTPLGVAS